MPDTRSAQFRVAEPGEAEATSQQRRDHRAIAGLCTWDVYDWVAMTPGSTCWWWTGSHDDRAGRPRWRHTSARATGRRSFSALRADDWAYRGGCQ